MKNQIKNIHYNSKEELYKAIKTLIGKVANTGNYNLFLHKAYDFNENGEFGKIITPRNNMQNILQTGLNLKKYSSLQQTSVYKGDLNIHKADDILNYDYPWVVSEQVIVIIALPFYVPINNKNADFSTPIFPYGAYSWNRNDNRNQYTMAFDALDYLQVPKEFILGAIVTNLPIEDEQTFIERGNKYELYLNENHISLMTKQQQEEFLKPIGLKIQQMFNINDTDAEYDISSKITKGLIEKDKINYYRGSYEEDFDFD